MYRVTRGLLGIGLFVAPLPVMAGGFIGASVGEADVDIGGYNSANSSKGFLGARIGDFGGEIAPVTLGTFMVTGSPESVDANGTEVIPLMYFYDVRGDLTLFGKLGWFLWNSSASSTGLTIPSGSGTDLTYGIGALYKHSALPFSIRVEYQIFEDVSTTDIDMWSIGAHFWL